MSKEIRKLLAISPKFKLRITGVTTSTFSLVKSLRNKNYEIQMIGFGYMEGIPKISILKIFQLYLRPDNADYRILHARRHNEMIFGIILKYIFQIKLKLVFTAAKQRPYSKFSQLLIKSMDHVIVTSYKTVPFVEPLFYKNKKESNYSVINHGVDTERFKPSYDKRTSKQKLNLDQKKNYIGCFGRIRPEKGTHLFIDAICRVLPNTKNWNAIVVGRITQEFNKYYEELKNNIKENNLEDRITFIDETSTIEDYYKILDIYVAPSLYEGFGLTPLEAMASCVPVIATDTGYYKEIVTHDCGYIVEKCSQDIAEHLKLYIEKPELLSKHSERSYERIQNHFKHEDEANQILSLYKKLQNHRY
jgi:mannosyltransferase